MELKRQNFQRQNIHTPQIVGTSDNILWAVNRTADRRVYKGQTMHKRMVECYELNNSRNFRLCLCISRTDDAQTNPQRTDSECYNDCVRRTTVQEFGHYDALPLMRQNNLCGCSKKMEKWRSRSIKSVLIFDSKMGTDKYSPVTRFSR